MTVIKFGKMEIVLDVKVEELEPCKGKVIPSWSYKHMKNVKFFRPSR